MVLAFWIVVVGVIAGLMAGCTVYQSGVIIEPGIVGQIHKNVTTREQVESMLGPPMNVELVSPGQRILKYWYKQIDDKGPGVPFAGGGGTLTRHQLLLVWIGAENKVLDVEFTDYVTDETVQGNTVVVRRAAVTTQPGAPPVWFRGGDE